MDISSPLPQRRLLRLSGFDYSQAYSYFVTICTKNRQETLSSIVGNGLDRSASVHLTPLGQIAASDLDALPQHFPRIMVDKYVIMPNHIHAILTFTFDDTTERSRPFPTLSSAVGLYKSGVSRRAGFSVWQKSYYDHIIRNDHDYREIWDYIENNPLRWEQDRFHPSRQEENI